MGILETLTLALGTSWASGINLYAAVAILGVLDAMGFITLPENLQILSSPLAIGVAVLLYVLEFFADKIPGVDSIWDALHTFIRIPAGGLMAMGIVEGLDVVFTQEMQTVAAFVAGSAVAAGSHVTKAGTRAVINIWPEPVTNWTASFLEDFIVVVGMFFAIFKPIVFLVIFAVFALIAIWIVPKIWGGIKKVFSNSRHLVNTMKMEPKKRMSRSLTHNSPQE